jgi:hypothetical protein
MRGEWRYRKMELEWKGGGVGRREEGGGVEQILTGSKNYLAAHQNWRYRKWREGRKELTEKGRKEGVFWGK